MILKIQGSGEDIRRTSNACRRPFRSYSSSPSLSLAVGDSGDQHMLQNIFAPIALGAWASLQHRKQSASGSQAWPRLAHLRLPPSLDRFSIHFLSPVIDPGQTRISIINLPQYRFRSSRSPRFDHNSLANPSCLPWNARSPTPKSPWRTWITR